MPAISALPAIISGGASIFSGILGSRASNKAADIQSQAAQQIADLIQRASGNVANVANQGGQQVLGGQAGASGAVSNAIGNSNSLLSQLFANQGQFIAPYQAIGQGLAQQGGDQLTSLMQQLYAPGGQLTSQFEAPTLEQAQNTPGYQFTLSEGLKALKRSAAGAGTLNTGDTAKAIAQYAQNLANTTYGDVYNRNLTTYQTNRQNAQNSLAPLFGLVQTGGNMGLSANQQFNQASENFGNQAGQNLMTGGMYAGNSLMDALKYAAGLNLTGAQAQMQGAEAAGDTLLGGANARAAGTVGSTNAWTNALGGAANAASSGLTLRQILNNPNIFGGGAAALNPTFHYYENANPWGGGGGGTGYWNLPTPPLMGGNPVASAPAMPDWMSAPFTAPAP